MRLKLDAATLRRLAVQASCSPETIKKVHAGQPVRGMAYYRARATLEEAGLLAPLSSEPKPEKPSEPQ